MKVSGRICSKCVLPEDSSDPREDDLLPLNPRSARGGTVTPSVCVCACMYMRLGAGLQSNKGDVYTINKLNCFVKDADSPHSEPVFVLFPQ